MRSLNDCYILEPEPIESSYKGSLVLPDKNSQWAETRWGRIVASGERCKLGLKPGTRVLCLKYAGAKFTIGDKEYISIKERDIDIVDDGA